MAVVGSVRESAAVLRLVGEFLGMVRRTVGTPLADWLTRAEQPAGAVVWEFVTSSRTDKAAVAAGLSTAWSSGPGVDHVYRLKLPNAGRMAGPDSVCSAPATGTDRSQAPSR